MNERPRAAQPIDPRLDRLGALMRTTSETDAPMQRHLEGRARLIAAVEEMRPSRRGRWIAATSILAAAAIIALVVGWRIRVTRSLSYAIDGAVATQGYVSLPPGAASATLRFSDGSDVVLAGGSRGRVASTTPDGAEIVLEAGRANVHVVHRDKTSWVVDAGPFAVRVTGTAFTVAWSAESETLDVWMKDGRVVVVGPGSEQGIAVGVGQHLHAVSRDRTLLIDGNADASNATAPPPATTASSEPAPEPPASSSAAPIAADDPASSPSSSTAPKSSASATTGWAQLVARGAYADVVREAKDQGEGTALASRSLGDLRALGDAARFTGDTGLATNAYATIRRRFPSSGEARTAAFLLGRIAEEQQRSPVGALRWYDTYLSEAPNGPFAGDALGRKMILVSKSSGAAAARPIAQDYLQRFPRGTYASAARNLTQ
jgi:ferric-dicitrate binding protein FerR (iron transport regulator)